MLFNSYEFIFAFLPITLLAYHLFSRHQSSRAGIYVLIAASLFFYAWWMPKYLLLLGVSIAVNYGLSKLIDGSVARLRKGWFVVGVALNLGLLGYYKYAGFIAETINAVGAALPVPHIVLPLAISFFTFQQIAYLADIYQRSGKPYGIQRYVLFVTFFPQLIAGPIVHHHEMLPQFRGDRAGLRASQLALGVTIFSIGLVKKAVFADSAALGANPVFAAVDAGQSVDLITAWGGALSYTLQLYFDFSGYSDMALGLAFAFGIRLPLNFFSPYKSTSIIEFWRRWHITLSRFLRDYLYIPLGGNKRGPFMRYRNLFITMLLGGLWHGAGWNFIIWGMLHGSYLLINHAWRRWENRPFQRGAGIAVSWLITMLAVIVGWVFFRATTFDGAWLMLEGMVGLHGAQLPEALSATLAPVRPLLESLGVTFAFGGGGEFVQTWVWVILLAFLAIAAPNSVEMTGFQPIDRRIVAARRVYLPAWPAPFAAAFLSLSLVLGILALAEVSEFLYFQF